MQELKEAYARWTGFTNAREQERERVMNPPGAVELRQQISDKKAEVLKAKAELQVLQAQLILNGGDTSYRKVEFDHEWTRKKALLKAEVEKLMAEQIEMGTSIPKMMKELHCKNPNWLYQVRENLQSYRGAAKEEMSRTTWYWSEVTSVHRYGLGHGENGSDWGFVLMHGAVDTEFEHEKCMFDFKSGVFIAGNRGLFDSVTTSVKRQRADMLAEILDGSYTKKVRRDTNPYFDVE